ncbi:DNA mismatch repair endonuclease MutL [Roseburia sp. AM16-25]|uniref:DNA mismatch repair endonuclease MutL n=1 Tax=Roseburia sp. AM16-25 TaxID=2292065 RepID=UPI000E4EAE3C|nr:DNA mismatch repair endonuclease MutL [Roseburia sp. AM16-25]RHO32204.1 DNA mismatch repair endonuclease MutL [Roseburia sp. AM16-25]
MVRNKIAVLEKSTIDKIAAGEVVERPSSVVKELVENAIDAGASAITVEIKDGGKSYIRITDNGCGIPEDELSVAFMRHSTSKLRDASELADIHTLGFRGEALSSISAVSRVEMITKPADTLMGVRYVIEGSKEVSLDKIGAPDGTTIMVYQLFFNTPARKKFLKTDTTEASYISELMERLALSHPDISFCLISNKKEKIHTSGNGNLMDTIYQIYGRLIASNLLAVEKETDLLKVSGFIGNSNVARGNRSLENFYINGRYIKSPLLSKSVEEGYVGYLMQHQYPFCVLMITTKEASVDVNVHPTKQEVRFDDEMAIADIFKSLIFERLHQREDIAEVTLDENVQAAPLRKTTENDATDPGSESMTCEPESKKEETIIEVAPEPFEKSRLEKMRQKITAQIHADTPYERKYQEYYQEKEKEQDQSREEKVTYEQTSFLSEQARAKHRIIGQVFDTYWLIEHDNKLYIIDQHAAHEKVLFERMMKQLQDKEMTTQYVSPPIIVSLTKAEQDILKRYEEVFSELGYVISSFGGNEFAIEGVPGNLFSFDVKEFFMELLASCGELKGNDGHDMIVEKVASMSCKAAVKGNNRLSYPEIEELLDELLSLENPYHCPHGRPTIIAMTKYELEKKFKRIV